MARTWIQIKVDLLGGGGLDLDPSPGRIFICGPSHSFGQLANAINAAFARWDLSHLHDFELADGRLIGYPDDEFEPDLSWEDQDALKPVKELKPGEKFVFTFDLGDNWHHRCEVLPDKVDPREVWNPDAPPRQPVAIWGWGTIPDQYGRDSGPEPDLDEPA